MHCTLMTTIPQEDRLGARRARALVKLVQLLVQLGLDRGARRVHQVLLLPPVRTIIAGALGRMRAMIA